MTVPPRFRWLVAIACTLSILILTWMPAPKVQTFSSADKLVHITIFGIMGLSWCWAGVGSVVAIVAAVAFAVITEVGQEMVPWHRSADWLDGVADVVGVVIAASAWAWLQRKRRLESARGGVRNGRDSNPR